MANELIVDKVRFETVQVWNNGDDIIKMELDVFLINNKKGVIQKFKRQYMESGDTFTINFNQSKKKER